MWLQRQTYVIVFPLVASGGGDDGQLHTCIVTCMGIPVDATKLFCIPSSMGYIVVYMMSCTCAVYTYSMHMLLWTRSQRSFEFTRIVMNDMRKNSMWDEAKAMLQAQVRWSDPRIKHENVSINIHAILVTMEKVKKFITADDWKTVVLELIKLCFPRAVKGQDQPYIFESGSEEKIAALLTPMGRSLTYLPRQPASRQANKKAALATRQPPPKATPHKRTRVQQKPVPMPGEILDAMVGDSAEGTRREISWIEDVLAMLESVLAPLSPSEVQQAAKRETISMALQFMGTGVLIRNGQETAANVSHLTTSHR
jgi:hypothetical protein